KFRFARLYVKYSPQLDGIRGIAIILVVIFHYFALKSTNEMLTQGSLLHNLLLEFKSGVDLFFVLSGLLLGSILMHQKNSKNYFRVFYTRRFVRIFPLYYLFLLAFVAFRAMGFDEIIPSLFEEPLPLWSYFTFTQNFWMGKLGITG